MEQSLQAVTKLEARLEQSRKQRSKLGHEIGKLNFDVTTFVTKKKKTCFFIVINHFKVPESHAWFVVTSVKAA